MLLTSTSPGTTPLLAQLALTIRADSTLSSSLHFRYSSAYNFSSVSTSPSVLRSTLVASRDAFNLIYEGVRGQIESAIEPDQRVLLEHALAVARKVPEEAPAGGWKGQAGGYVEEQWKSIWNWNMTDVGYGALVFAVEAGKLAVETTSRGEYGPHHRIYICAKRSRCQQVSISLTAVCHKTRLQFSHM